VELLLIRFDDNPFHMAVLRMGTQKCPKSALVIP